MPALSPVVSSISWHTSPLQSEVYFYDDNTFNSYPTSPCEPEPSPHASTSDSAVTQSLMLLLSFCGNQQCFVFKLQWKERKLKMTTLIVQPFHHMNCKLTPHQRWIRSQPACPHKATMCGVCLSSSAISRPWLVIFSSLLSPTHTVTVINELPPHSGSEGSEQSIL